MKIIVIGPSLSGKTTLARLLRSLNDFIAGEIDEELVRHNNGQFPTDVKLKHEILAPKVVNEVLNKDNIIFFTNTDYFSVDDIKTARERKFKIVELVIDLEHPTERNTNRIKNDGYDDVSKWFSGMLKYMDRLNDEKLIDKTIDANLSTDKIATELLKA